jgi:hypothetical protein
MAPWHKHSAIRQPCHDCPRNPAARPIVATTRQSVQCTIGTWAIDTRAYNPLGGRWQHRHKVVEQPNTKADRIDDMSATYTDRSYT